MGRYYYSLILLLSVVVVDAASIKLTGWTTNANPASARSALGVTTNSQTPWLQTLDAGGHSLTNASILYVTNKIEFSVQSTNRAIDLTLRSNVYEDIVFDVTTINPAGAETAGEIVSDSGNGSDQLALRMTALDVFFVPFQMPHNWVAGTPIYPHIHVTPQTANTNYMLWEIRHSISQINDTFPTSTIVTNGIGIPAGSQYKHLLFNLPTNGLTMSGMTNPSSMVRTKYKLISSDEAVDIISFDIHYRFGGTPVVYTP